MVGRRIIHGPRNVCGDLFYYYLKCVGWDVQYVYVWIREGWIMVVTGYIHIWSWSSERDRERRGRGGVTTVR